MASNASFIDSFKSAPTIMTTPLNVAGKTCTYSCAMTPDYLAQGYKPQPWKHLYEWRTVTDQDWRVWWAGTYKQDPFAQMVSGTASVFKLMYQPWKSSNESVSDCGESW